MTALSIENLSLTLGGTQVLSNITLHVEEGEFVSILGPSGCGKSSLFRILTGSIQPDRGQIRVGDDHRTARAGSFAFMPQRDALMPWRRIIDNITLGLEVQGISRAEARALAEPMLPEFGLAGFGRHYPHQLSGGMRQRAALLRTVLQGRPIQLLDEPFGALDALTRAGMQRWLERRWRAAGWTTILVTHDVREAVALSDRVYVFSPRPAQVVQDIRVDAPRPRLGRPIRDASRRIEDQLLETLLEQRSY